VGQVIREHNRRRWLLLAVFAVPVAILSLGALTIVRQGAVVVHQCVPASGVNGWLGVQFALLRVDSDCPPGALAVGGDAHHALGIVAMVALPVLLAHVAGASIWLGLAAMLRRLIVGAVALLRRVIPALPVPSDVIRFRYAGPVATTHLAGLDRLAASCLWRRGPPALRAA